MLLANLNGRHYAKAEICICLVIPVVVCHHTYCMYLNAYWVIFNDICCSDIIDCLNIFNPINTLIRIQVCLRASVSTHEYPY